jgi:hypothetical protein
MVEGPPILQWFSQFPLVSMSQDEPRHPHSRGSYRFWSNSILVRRTLYVQELNQWHASVKPNGYGTAETPSVWGIAKTATDTVNNDRTAVHHGFGQPWTYVASAIMLMSAKPISLQQACALRRWTVVPKIGDIGDPTGRVISEGMVSVDPPRRISLEWRSNCSWRALVRGPKSRWKFPKNSQNQSRFHWFFNSQPKLWHKGGLQLIQFVKRL